ncbi:MAG: transposase [Actinomycetota bacterium]|nr:MAG: transposase [Actinomycetota bacterium]
MAGTGTSELKVRYSYRLRLSRASERKLMAEWDRCRFVWNQCVTRSKELREAGEQCGPARLDKELTALRSEKPWLKEGSSVAQQQTIRDFGAARSKAVKDVMNKAPMTRRRGFPRFKKKDLALPSINYTRRGFSLKGGRLHLAGGIELGVVWSRELPSAPTSVRISRDSCGKWWASFVTKTRADPLPQLNRAIGVDWGVKEIATTTDEAFDLPHPNHGKTGAAKLAKYQRMMARRKRPKGVPKSNRYKKAQLQTANAYAKVARKRKDDTRKWAKNVIYNHDQIAVEDFKPKFLAISTMARRAADGGIGQAKRELIWMAVKHGRDLRVVDPRYTTKDCCQCGARAKHALPLSERTYTCSACGSVRPRDRNSAAVMVARAGFNPTGVDRVRLDHPTGDQAA